MKKKILIFTLSLLLTFTSSINSFANPLVVGKLAEVSIVYGIGRIAMDLVGFVGTVADVMQLGTSIYEKMSDKEKEDIQNNIKYDNEGLTYNKELLSSVGKYLPSKGYHYMKDFKIEFKAKHYRDSSNNLKNIEQIFEDNL